MQSRRWLFVVAVVTLAATALAQGFRAQATVERGNRAAGDNANVVVWLTPMGKASPVSASEAHHYRLAQKNKRFEPHLLVIPVGSIVDFPNEDPFFHNVFSLYKGKKFDLGLYESGTSRSVRFDRPGVSFIFCNIHPQMSASILALSTPYYGVSNRAGEVQIPDVPPGRYKLEAWYEGAAPEELESLAREVNVSGDSPVATLRVHQLFEGGVPHKNKYGKDYEPDHSYVPH